MQRRTTCAVIGILVGTLGLSIVPAARSQYTDNFQDTIINGVSSNWSGDYVVGSNTFADILFVQSNGLLADGNGYLGYEASGSNNVAAVIDSGSVWSNSNSLYVGNSGANNFLWIAGGGAVVASNSYLGYNVTGTNNETLVSGQGSVWSNSGDLTVGWYGSSNTVTIGDGGKVYDSGGFVGRDYSSTGNTVLVTGTGSVWSNSDALSMGVMFSRGSEGSLTISNGGAVFSGSGSIIGVDNAAVVTGSGSVWNCGSYLVIGDASGGVGASLTIAAGGAVYTGSAGIGPYSSAVRIIGTGSVWSSSGSLGSEGTLTIADGGALYTGTSEQGGDTLATIVVTGPGSVWHNAGTLALGAVSPPTRLTISDGGAVYCGDNVSLDGQAAVVVAGAGSTWQVRGELGWDAEELASVSIIDGSTVVASGVSGPSPYIAISGGAALYVTNESGIIALTGPFGNVTINGGTMTVNQLVVTNFNYGFGGATSFGLDSGLLNSGSTYMTNGENFVIGDGTDVATFHPAGGFHSFADGLMVSSNSFVTGCGTIDGSVVVDPGGAVLANCGGSLTFTGIVINNGTLRATGGSVLEFYSPVVNNGLIDITGGTTNFHSTFINNGSIISGSPFQITGIVQQANNILITWLTSPGQTNELQVTAGGPDGSYSANNFAAIFAVTNTVGSVTNYLDIGGATNAPARYYRVRLVP